MHLEVMNVLIWELWSKGSVPYLRSIYYHFKFFTKTSKIDLGANLGYVIIKLAKYN